MAETHPLRAWRVGQTPRRSIKDLASECGVAFQHVGAIEVGRRKPSLALALRLAEVTGLGVEAFAEPGRQAARVKKAKETNP